MISLSETGLVEDPLGWVCKKLDLDERECGEVRDAAMAYCKLIAPKRRRSAWQEFLSECLKRTGIKQCAAEWRVKKAKGGV